MAARDTLIGIFLDEALHQIARRSATYPGIASSENVGPTFPRFNYKSCRVRFSGASLQSPETAPYPIDNSLTFRIDHHAPATKRYVESLTHLNI